MRWPQHPSNEHLLARECPTLFPQLAQDFLLRNRAGVLPLPEIFTCISEGTGNGSIIVRADHQGVELKQLRNTFPLCVIQLALIRVVEKLIYSLLKRIGHVSSLALDDHKWQAIYEQYDIRSLSVRCAFDEYLKLVDGEELILFEALGLPCDGLKLHFFTRLRPLRHVHAHTS